MTLDIRVNNGEMVKKTFIISGITDVCYKFSLVGGYFAFISIDDMPQEMRRSTAYISLKNPKQLEDSQYISHIESEYSFKNFKTNNSLLQSYYIFPDANGIWDFLKNWSLIVLVGIVVLLASGLVIYNVMHIMILKKMEQYGTIRAIGGGRKQIYAILYSYVSFMFLIAIPLGIFFGYIISQVIAKMIASNWTVLFQHSEQGLNDAVAQNAVVSLPAVIISFLIVAVFVLLATYPCIRKVVGVSPVTAMNGWEQKVGFVKARKKEV